MLREGGKEWPSAHSLYSGLFAGSFLSLNVFHHLCACFAQLNEIFLEAHLLVVEKIPETILNILNSPLLPPRNSFQSLQDILLPLCSLKLLEIPVLILHHMELLQLQDHPLKGVFLQQSG